MSDAMELLDALSCGPGNRALAFAMDDGLELLRGPVEEGAAPLGGTRLAVHVAAGFVGGEMRKLYDTYLVPEVPDLYDGQYNFVEIAEQKSNRSIRTGKAVHELPDTDVVEGEVIYKGNAVILLLDDLVLVVSCSGLDEEWDRTAADILLGLALFNLASLLQRFGFKLPPFAKVA